ncbi:Multidrug resistance protein NorM [termite gut metagenome]|uniref:Multidrug-efflux transporter n=1 Tax=termite gut metagenome TaxID=433724 RepID=A0A5J4SWJ2_9ZZZZ
MKTFYENYKRHYKALLFLGVPIVIGQLGIVILGFTDTLMVGWHSTEELGAASFVNNIFNLIIIFGIGFSYGLTPVVGGFYGNNKPFLAGQVLKCGLLANALMGLLMILVMYIVYLNLENLGQPAELIPIIKPFYLLSLVSLIFVMIFNAFKQFFDGITDTRTSMWILLGGNLLNIAGNYVLINGKYGFPELGLLGSGISTLFARMIMVAASVWVCTNSHRLVRYKVGFSRFGLSWKIFRRLNMLGLPIGLQMGMEASAFSLSTVMIGWLGAIALASHQVMCTVSTVIFMTYYGVGAAIAIRVSNFKAQNDWINIRRSAYAGFHLMMITALTFSILLYLFRYRLGGWFTDNTEVALTVVTLVFPTLLYQFGDGLQVTFANALRGISDVKPMMLIAFIAYFIVSLPAGYFFGFILNWGVLGVWMAFPFGLTSAGIMLWYRFKKSTSCFPE